MVGTEGDYREREKRIWHFVNSDFNFRSCKVNFSKSFHFDFQQHIQHAVCG